ncbi:TfoX family protein [bacterium]|nr:MAG: TfoX family protein [bacterium]
MLTTEAVERILAALNSARPVTSRKMFGGVGLYTDGAFFGVIDDDRLYLKSDAATDGVYDTEEAAQWILPQGPMPYREVRPHLLSDPERLGERIDSAVAIWRAKNAKKKPRQSK